MNHTAQYRHTATGCQVGSSRIYGGAAQNSMVEIDMPRSALSQQSLKARLLLARNIDAILQARGETQTALAFWCRRKSSWINKILAGKRPMHIDDFDRVADFLGISVYQLFQPGISALTERRRPGDRRAARDRRIGHRDRIDTIRDSLPTRTQRDQQDEATLVTSAADVQAEIEALVADFSARASSLLAGTHPRRQAPRTRKTVAQPRQPRKPAGRSDVADDRPRGESA